MSQSSDPLPTQLCQQLRDKARETDFRGASALDYLALSRHYLVGERDLNYAIGKVLVEYGCPLSTYLWIPAIQSRNMGVIDLLIEHDVSIIDVRQTLLPAIERHDNVLLAKILAFAKRKTSCLKKLS